MITAMDLAWPGKGRTADPHGDAALVEACLAGDEGAWSDLVDRYGRLVYTVARRCGLSEADAEDAYQNVFLCLYRHLASLRDRQRLASWLTTVARREAIRIGRGRPTAVEGPLQLAESGQPPAHDEVASLERAQLVREALDRLGGRCERLLAVCLGADVRPSHQQIGRMLGMRPGSVGPTRARCFAKLRRILEQMGFEPGP